MKSRFSISRCEECCAGGTSVPCCVSGCIDGVKVDLTTFPQTINLPNVLNNDCFGCAGVLTATLDLACNAGEITATLEAFCDGVSLGTDTGVLQTGNNDCAISADDNFVIEYEIAGCSVQLFLTNYFSGTSAYDCYVCTSNLFNDTCDVYGSVSLNGSQIRTDPPVNTSATKACRTTGTSPIIFSGGFTTSDQRISTVASGNIGGDQMGLTIDGFGFLSLSAYNEHDVYGTNQIRVLKLSPGIQTETFAPLLPGVQNTFEFKVVPLQLSNPALPLTPWRVDFRLTASINGSVVIDEIQPQVLIIGPCTNYVIGALRGTGRVPGNNNAIVFSYGLNATF